jgi:uncharacterized membrane-anchored protein
MGRVARGQWSEIPARGVLHFWLLKIATTTLGETGGDAVSRSMGLGYLASTAIFAGLFLLALVVHVRTPLRAGVYWATIVATTTVSTTFADLANRSLGVGYWGGAALLLALLLAWMGTWFGSLGWTPDLETVTTPRGAAFYWVTILLAQALGSSVGDWIGEHVGWGSRDAVLLLGGLLGVAVARLAWKKGSKTVPFWAALLLTRPFSVLLGDLLNEPAEAGGMGLDRFATSAALLALVALLVARRPRRSAGATAAA